jgi:hypothetical protein
VPSVPLGQLDDRAFQAIEEKIRANTRAVLDESTRRHILPREAATALAVSRVEEARRDRRFSVMETPH